MNSPRPLFVGALALCAFCGVSLQAQTYTWTPTAARTTCDSKLGLAGNVSVASGATLSLLNDDAIADNAILKLEQFGLFNGRMSLTSGVEETVGSLFFGENMQLPGTWGSTASLATFQNDTYFSGAGVLTVVPEPGSAAMLLCGAGVLLGLWRRRA